MSGDDKIITISGLPGSGTTTAAELLSKRTGMKMISSGEIFRELAREHDVTLEEFGALAEEDEDIDRELDRRIIEEAGPGRILEGRLTGHMVDRSNKDAYKVWIEADREVRVNRIAERENEPVSLIRSRVKERERSERKRYKEYYGIDIEETSIYDIVIDSEENDPDEVVDMIIEGVEDGVGEGED